MIYNINQNEHINTQHICYKEDNTKDIDDSELIMPGEIDDLNRKIENLFQGNYNSENQSKENINLPVTIKSI